MSSIIRVDSLDLVFGNSPQRAFDRLDRGESNQKIQAETGQLVAVRGISFEVHRGELLVLMGLSGSGKSSLLRCLNGMNGRGVGALRGKIVLFPGRPDQVSVSECSKGMLRSLRRQTISMVFQQFGLMPWRTVWQNVAYPLQLQGRSKEEIQIRVKKQLDTVGLLEWKNRYPRELSGGMQQRVGLARAFVTDAEILLMDEPFSALDPIHRRHLQDEVLQLQKKLQKTIIFVSHDFSEAARIGSRVAILDSGRLLQIGKTEDVIRNPSSEPVQRLVSAALSS